MGACASIEIDEIDEIEVLRNKLEMAEGANDVLENEKQTRVAKLRKLKKEIEARDKELTELLDYCEDMRQTIVSLKRILKKLPEKKLKPYGHGPDLTVYFKPV